jgi:hypothetical protein
MQTIRHIIKTPKNHFVQIPIPNFILENESVEIIVMLKEQHTEHGKKISELKSAINDPLFLQDIKEIEEDFSFVDKEHWAN